MRRLSVFAASLAACLALAIGLTGLGSSAAQASPSSNCWAYVGGTTSWGGCQGHPIGGTYFRVHTVCATWYGYAFDAPGSGVGYSPPNRSQIDAQQGGVCGWGSSPVDAWVESW